MSPRRGCPGGRCAPAVAALAVLCRLRAFLPGCATTHPRPPAAPPGTGQPAPEKPGRPSQEKPDHAAENVGIASYYAKKLDGHRTANGERYDMKELTAAHRTLPFGSRVRV